MLTRVVALTAGLAGAAGLSQFPEFSQQYQQRLGGAVDELSRVVAEFDADAAAYGLSREAALAQLATGGDFGAGRAETMRATVARYDRLRADLAALEAAGPFARARMATRLTDREIAARTFQAYKPALPLTPQGLSFALAGFAFFGGLAGLAGRMARRLFTRRAFSRGA
ncbi:DUF2937 family protein [Roseivivax sp.]